MIVMVLDHTRDFFHAGAMTFSPEDLTKTTPALFLTRWVTHFCAPVFMLLAGMGAYLWEAKGRTKGELSRYLLSRGLWIVALEVTAFHLSIQFNFRYQIVYLATLWALGMSMVLLAGLVHLPLRWLAGLSAAVVLGHNAFDGATGLGWLGTILHQPGALRVGNWNFFLMYPLAPWFAVMSLGYCLGALMRQEKEVRQRWMVWLGMGMTVGFVVLRALNVYGDPGPWDGKSWMSFLKTNKYPPSLDYLLMTLGPALLGLRALERWKMELPNPLIVFGRVPLTFFVAHFFALHLLAFPLAWAMYGKAGFLFEMAPSFGGAPGGYPAGYGFDLPVVYGIWVGMVVALYPASLWFARVKARRRDWWLSYL